MADQNPVFERLEKQKQHISAMLPSWLMGTIKRRALPGSEKTQSPSSVVNGLLITQRRPLIQARNAAVLPTNRFASFEKLVLQKYALAREFSSSIVGFSRDAKQWGEIDRIFPSQASKVQEERAQPGEMKRGTIIQRMAKLPKIGETTSSSKPQPEVVDNQRLQQSKRPTKVDIAPGQRLFTHVREITGTRPPVVEEKEQPKTEIDFPISKKPVEKDASREVNSEKVEEEIVIPGHIEPDVTEEVVSKRQGLPQQQRQDIEIPIEKLSPKAGNEPVKDQPVAVPVKKPAVEEIRLPKAKPVESSRRLPTASPASQPSTSQSVQRQVDTEDRFIDKRTESLVQADMSDQHSPEVPKLAVETPVISASKLAEHDQTSVKEGGSTPVDSGSYSLQPQLLQRKERSKGLLHTTSKPKASQKVSSIVTKESHPPIIRREKYLFNSLPSNIDRDSETKKSQDDVKEPRHTPIVSRPMLLKGKVEEKLPEQTAGTETGQTTINSKPVPVILPAQQQPRQSVFDYQPSARNALPEVDSASSINQNIPGVKLHLPLRMETARQPAEAAQQKQELPPPPQVFEPVMPTKKEEPFLLNEPHRHQPARTAETGSLPAVKTSSSPAVVQRYEDATHEAVSQDIDYDRLAEDVFPYIKHLIEIERERLLGR